MVFFTKETEEAICILQEKLEKAIGIFQEKLEKAIGILQEKLEEAIGILQVKLEEAIGILQEKLEQAICILQEKRKFYIVDLLWVKANHFRSFHDCQLPIRYDSRTFTSQLIFHVWFYRGNHFVCSLQFM